MLVGCVLADYTPGTADERLGRLDALTAAQLERAVLLDLGRPAESARASRRFAAAAHRAHDPEFALLDTGGRVGLCLLRGESEEARILPRRPRRVVALASPRLPRWT